MGAVRCRWKVFAWLSGAVVRGRAGVGGAFGRGVYLPKPSGWKYCCASARISCGGCSRSRPRLMVGVRRCGSGEAPPAGGLAQRGCEGG